MAENQITSIMDITLEKLRAMVDANTVVGTPITVGNFTLVPVSKVAFGLASGGTDLPNKAQQPVFGGGSGAGVSVTPVAFIVVGENGVRSIPITADSTVVDRAISAVPDLVELFKPHQKSAE